MKVILAVFIAIFFVACTGKKPSKIDWFGGSYDEAIALYREALELDPRLAIAWNGLSMAHRSSGAIDEAIRAGARLVELEPDDPLSHTNLSILYMQKGMIPEAEEERAVAMQLQMQAQRRR